MKDNCVDKLLIEITKNCNLKCPYCFYSKGEKSTNNFFTLESLAKLLNEFNKANVFLLTGGEPLLHPDFLKIINILKDRGDVTVFTNGTLLEEKLFNDDFLKSIEFIYISIDDCNEIQNNLFRGEFKNTLQNIKSLIKINNEKVVIKLCVHSDNIFRFEEIFKYYLNIGVKHFSINFIFSNIFSDISNTLYSNELLKIFTLFENYRDYWQDYEYISILKGFLLNGKNYKSLCKCGTEIVFIDTDCNYYNCPEEKLIYPGCNLDKECFSKNCLSIFELFKSKRSIV